MTGELSMSARNSRSTRMSRDGGATESLDGLGHRPNRRPRGHTLASVASAGGSRVLVASRVQMAPGERLVPNRPGTRQRMDHPLVAIAGGVNGSTAESWGCRGMLIRTSKARRTRFGSDFVARSHRRCRRQQRK